MNEEDAGQLVRFFLNEIAAARIGNQTLAEAIQGFKRELRRFGKLKRNAQKGKKGRHEP